MIRDIEVLEDQFKIKVKKFIEELEAKKISYFINETKRTVETQTAYFAQGRKNLITVNALRKKAGLWAITEKENKNIVTKTLNSKHIIGKAIDIVPAKDGKPNWNADDAEYKAIADIAISVGIDAGFYWKWQDKPHYEDK